MTRIFIILHPKKRTQSGCPVGSHPLAEAKTRRIPALLPCEPVSRGQRIAAGGMHVALEFLHFSKLQLQQKLELTRRTHSYRSGIQRQIDDAEVGSRNEAVRVGKLCSIENVEHLSPELKLYLFGDRKASGKSPIQLPDSGTSQEIAGDIAESRGAEDSAARVERVCSPGSAKSRGIEVPAGQI